MSALIATIGGAHAEGCASSAIISAGSDLADTGVGAHAAGSAESLATISASQNGAHAEGRAKDDVLVKALASVQTAFAALSPGSQLLTIARRRLYLQALQPGALSTPR